MRAIGTTAIRAVGIDKPSHRRQKHENRQEIYYIKTFPYIKNKILDDKYKIPGKSYENLAN